MLTNTTNLKGLVIRATDGEVGTVDQLYFDDESWAIRYLTVKTGSWPAPSGLHPGRGRHSPWNPPNSPFQSVHEEEHKPVFSLSGA